MPANATPPTPPPTSYPVHMHAYMSRNSKFVFVPFADLVFYLVGSGEYDELAGR